MDARPIRIFLTLSVLGSLGATYPTPNFIVHASSPELAREVALTAERCREEIALDWLGKKLKQWWKPCEVTVKEGQIGAGGATSFQFDRGEVFGWRMQIQGTRERLLDSVVPHEVSHTIFASHFRRPLPRWADEGAATLVEHESERRRQQLMLNQVMRTNRGIPLRKLLSMKEYPSGMQNVLTLYAQGHSLADFLVQQGGKARYLKFLDDAHRHGWDNAIQRHYALRSVDLLESRWSDWVMAGSPSLPLREGEQLADGSDANPSDAAVIRSQNPERADGGRGGQNRGSASLAGRDQLAAGTRLPQSARPANSGHTPGRMNGRPVAYWDEGNRRANEDWTPQPEPRKQRPEPLLMRWKAEKHPGGPDRQIPLNAAPTGRSGQERRGGQQSPPRLSPHWSDFPASSDQRRSDATRTRN